MTSWARVQQLTADIADRLERGVNRYGAAYGYAPVRVDDCVICDEVWSAAELGDRTDMAARINPKILFQPDGRGGNEVERPPRRADVPPVFVRFGRGYGLVDGRHRVNHWRRGGGEHSVIVLDYSHHGA